MTEKDLSPNLDVLQRLFNLDKRTLEAFKGDILKRAVNKSSFLGRLSITPWFVWLISIFERWVAPNMSKGFELNGDDFVFISCIDPVHRVKTLPIVAKGLKYTLIFLPTVTRPTVVQKYYKHYKENSTEKVFFGTFTYKDVRKYRKFIKENAHQIKEIVCDNYNDTKVLREYAKRYALYSIFTQRVFGNATSDKVWLFEHDKFFFIPVIDYFRKRGIMTTQLQHGTFFNPENTTYFPLYSDKIICCSEREKELYKKTGVKEDDIYILGAPLQTIGQRRQFEVEDKYDILIVLTETSPKKLELQKKVLTYIKEQYKDKSVLLRFRPRSAMIDKENLAGFTVGFRISEGTTLSEDLGSAKKVITFSLDSIYEIIRDGKIFTTFVDAADLQGRYLDGICNTVDNMVDSIQNLLDTDTDKERDRYVSVFGETDLIKLRDGFNGLINGLKRIN